MKIKYLGDSALALVYDNIKGSRDNGMILRDFFSLRENPPAGIDDIVLCYKSVGVYFNPQIIGLEGVKEYVRSNLSRVVEGTEKPKRISIPIYYGGSYGPDLNRLAELLDITEDQIINYHSRKTYTVRNIGFLPGFPYMGRLSSKLVVPRKKTPVLKVAAGSVAIAGNMTGIYPFDSPGGWHVIGWTPLKMFDLGREEPCLLKPGDKVKFTVQQEQWK